MMILRSPFNLYGIRVYKQYNKLKEKAYLDEFHYNMVNMRILQSDYPCEPLSPEENDFKVNFKTEICRNLSLGVCEWGDKCIFAHGYVELREKKVQKTNYKTKKCKQFHQTGYCIYGNRCQFKHKDQSIDFHESTRKRLPVFVNIERRGDNNN